MCKKPCTVLDVIIKIYWYINGHRRAAKCRTQVSMLFACRLIHLVSTDLFYKANWFWNRQHQEKNHIIDAFIFSLPSLSSTVWLHIAFTQIDLKCTNIMATHKIVHVLCGMVLCIDCVHQFNGRRRNHQMSKLITLLTRKKNCLYSCKVARGVGAGVGVGVDVVSFHFISIK